MRGQGLTESIKDAGPARLNVVHVVRWQVFVAQAQLATLPASVDFNGHARGLSRAAPLTQGKDQTAGRDDLQIPAAVLGARAVAPLREAERATDARVDLDMRHRARGGCKQPLARDLGVEPGVEYALRRSPEALRDVYRSRS